MRPYRTLSLLVLLLSSLPAVAAEEQAEKPAAVKPLLAVAESTEYRATARYADVMDFCRRLADRSPNVALADLGKSHEGRSLPLLILADPPVTAPEQVKRPEKLVVLAMGNIHAGEVCGKEALLMLARDLATAAERPLLNDLVLLLAPLYNADGNERVSRDNRPRQIGPEDGVGVRHNAQGLDLNRDYIKLESPETRAVVRLLTKWDPALVIDCHTTNGSYHRYALTYDGPRHPATEPALSRFVRDEFLPEVSRRLKQETNYETFFYGNFDAAHRTWRTYPALPRFGTHYFGLRNRIGILSEAYAYAPYRDRVLATRDFVRHCLALCAKRKPEIAKLLQEARGDSSRAVTAESPKSSVAIQSKSISIGEFSVPGYVEERRDGRLVPTDATRDYQVEYLGQEETTLAVSRPHAYLIPADCEAAIQNLLDHGVAARVLREDIELDVEVYRLAEVKRRERPYGRHHLVALVAEARSESQRVPAGTVMIRTDQALSSLIVTLLEPQSPDGLATWNFFDEWLSAGGDYPVLRLPRPSAILTGELQDPRDVITKKQAITFDVLYGRRPPRLSGSPTTITQWLDDGEHFLQSKDGQVRIVQAATGRSSELYDQDKLAEVLKSLEGIEADDAKRLAARARTQMSPARKAALFSHRQDLYYATLYGNEVARLTDTQQAEELARFSPDGKRVAFVRDFDLYVVDVTTQKERRLTEGGSQLVRRGKADWVYYEEINNRNWRAFKWSPNSQAIVFQEYDDSKVGMFTVLNHVPVQQEVESERYPLAGQPNPLVRLGVVTASGGDVQWIDMSEYSPDNLLITHFGFYPDSTAVFVYVQDRTQSWLDFLRGSVADGSTTRLFREQTEAWVDNPGDPHFLKDGSFLLPSERDGWKHLYRFGADGKLRGRVTEGEWEVRQLNAVNEQQGWVYFTATRDSHLASNLYRVQLDGGEPSRLTKEPGSHRVSVNKRGDLFVDSWSDHRAPTRVQLCNADGQPARVLDTNPVPDMQKYVVSPLELVQIKTRDGCLMEGSLVKPPDFDPGKQYPVWLMTYGGPHAPSLSDSWRGGRTYEQMLAQMGILAFRCDPRSASGKGARSTWTAYRQLGIQELRDLEDALDWLAEKPFVDASRIGMSGHSYGGFLTAFALTHSDRFAAGIAGAPVTDWRNYDTIYTERYMSTPQDNPEGYENTSVVSAAKNLHGSLLLIHGARDDNVHLANTLQLAHALQRADKKFEMMIYPPNRHGIGGMHYRRLMLDFIRRTMLEE